MNWEKKGIIFSLKNVNDGIDRPWMKEFAQCTSTLIFDNFIRIYFSCRPYKGEDGQAVSYTTFIDVDKSDYFNIINIAKEPVLPLGELGCFDEFAVYPSSVIRYNGEVRLYYAGWTRCKSVPFNTAIGMAISQDNGVTFNRLGKGPIIGHSLQEPFVVSGPKVRIFNGKWFMYYLAGKEWLLDKQRPEIVYKIRMATSDDGISWQKTDKDIIENILEPTECQAGPDVFFYNGMYHMYFVYRYALDFRNNRDRGYRIGYAHSSDLFNWVRDDKNAGITYSGSGEWDGDMMHYPHVFSDQNQLHMLYNGNDFGRAGFGYAILKNG